MKASFLLSLIILFGLSFLLFPSVAHASSRCTPETFLVKLSPLDEAEYHVAAQLCWQGNLSGKTLQLLIPGYTYDHTYWDFPYEEPTYSYTTSAVNAGYATLSIDRIGTGQSDHPAPELVTLQSEAYTIHQIVADLRAETVEATSFPKIVLVGHSLGTLIAWQEAAAYQDVDGIVASGWQHALNPVNAALVPASTYPAALDPKFANSNFPVGYLTTLPGSRKTLFFNQSAADPALIALDEQLKQTGTDGELATFGLGDSPVNTLLIHVPVLSAMGQSDGLFCNVLLSCANASTIVAREATFYNHDACLEGFVLPQSGHDMNLHYGASAWYTAANNWISRRVGSSVNTPPTNPCTQ